MSNFNKINDVYLEMINESFSGKVCATALLGSTLLGNLDAATVNNNDSSKLNGTAKITKTAPKFSKIPLTEDELFIARTLYSETSTLCTYEEIIAIACVIQNRVGLKDFGNCKNELEVCKHPGTFTSVTKHNSNWDKYSTDLNIFANYDAKVAKILISSKFRLAGKPWMKDIVYYHDKSISKPKSWDNKYYTAILVKETPKFKFYKVEKKK